MSTAAKHTAPDPIDVINILERLFGARTRRRQRPSVRAPGTEIDVGALRRRLGLSQPAFARRYRLSAASLRKWEQGLRAPDAAARAYLTVIGREPHLVAAALSPRYGARAMRVSELIAALDDLAGR
jgi:DNA-binding transcriptional regulator YiaG